MISLYLIKKNIGFANHFQVLYIESIILEIKFVEMTALLIIQ
jgi:hypothetical protein